MPNDLDSEFLRRISTAESNLSSLQRSSLDDFNQEWTTLVEDLRVAIDSKSISVVTITTAHALAYKVELSIQSFLDLDILAEKLMSSILDEPTPPTPRIQDITGPPYIKLSYDWLLENINNPYPSPKIRNAISEKSGAARRDVDNWFIDARKRIGWNDARKAHFANKRLEIVDAATRFFSNDEKLVLTQGAEHALVSIMKNAKDLYADRFHATPLASKLDILIQDLTPQAKVDAKVEQMRQQQIQKDKNLYPTPERSPEPSPSLGLDVEDSAHQYVSRTGRKRRSPSTEPLDQADTPSAPKRPRINALSPNINDIVDTYTGLLSPATSIDEPLESVESNTAPCSCTPSVSLPPVPSRKRRLSDSDGQETSKRPRHLSADPHLHAVSDLLFQSDNIAVFDETAFDGWFKKTLDLPHAPQLSPSGFELELGVISDFECATPPDSHSSSPAIREKTLEPPTLEIADVACLDVPWSDLDFGWSDTLLLPPNNTIAPNLLANFVEQESRAPLIQDLSDFQLCSQGTRSLVDVEDLFSLSPPTIVDPVAVPLHPASNEIWNVSVPAINPSQDPDFGRQSTFNPIDNDLVPFDFSDNVDSLRPSYYLGIDQHKARQEKEKEFREAYAKAQRLALELQKGEIFAL